MRVDRIVRSYRKQYNQEIVIRRLHECAVMTWENLGSADLNAAKQNMKLINNNQHFISFMRNYLQGVSG